MLAKCLSSGVIGIDAIPITVEVDITGAAPFWNLVGLPDAAVQESRERVRAAICNCGFTFPIKRITINLAPADARKEGPSFDLPIAVGILAASEQINGEMLEDTVMLGELSLDGKVRAVTGVLPVALAAQKRGVRRLIVPAANTNEAAIVGGLEVYPVTCLGDVITALMDPGRIPAVTMAPNTLMPEHPPYALDFSDVKGQAHVKRALEVAAAGGPMALCAVALLALAICVATLAVALYDLTDPVGEDLVEGAIGQD